MATVYLAFLLIQASQLVPSVMAGGGTAPESDSDNSMYEHEYTDGNLAHGDVCPGLAYGNNIIPTCGWSMELSSAYPMYSVKIYNLVTTTLDDYTLNIVSKPQNRNMTSLQSSCFTTTIEGDFGGNDPSITLYYQCVCNASFPDNCEPTSNLTTTATAPEATTVDEATLDGTSTSSPITTDVLESRLKKVENYCFNGTSLTTIPNVRQALKCISLCVSKSDCTGVNYRASSSSCDIVKEAIEETSNSHEPNCQCWEIL